MYQISIAPGYLLATTKTLASAEKGANKERFLTHIRGMSATITMASYTYILGSFGWNRWTTCTEGVQIGGTCSVIQNEKLHL